MSRRTWVDHTAELELLLEAATPEGVFSEAAAALGELVSASARGEPEDHAVSLAATDRASLLVDFLGELVYLADTRGFAPERAVVSLERGLHGVVHGRRAEIRPLVKAVTYHRLSFEEEGGLWRARVVLDV